MYEQLKDQIRRAAVAHHMQETGAGAQQPSRLSRVNLNQQIVTLANVRGPIACYRFAVDPEGRLLFSRE